MMRTNVAPASFVIILGAFLAVQGPATSLAAGTPAAFGTLERAAGMEAVERVRWRHRGGSPEDFEARYPAAFWEDRARDVEAGTRALEERFGTAVDDAVLERELLRICRTTGSPGRLRELFAALGNDPVRIKECLVRPLVVKRLLHRRIEQDREIQREPLERARELARHPEVLRAGTPEGCRMEERVVTMASSKGGRQRDALVLPEHRWRRLRRALGAPGTVLGPEDGGDALVFRILVSAGEDGLTERLVAVPKVDPDRWWREHRRLWAGPLPAGLAAQPAPLPPIREGASRPDAAGSREKAGRAVENGSWEYVWPFPGPMTDFAAVWTGSEMLVFGSADADEPGALGGARYDPASDTWTPMAALEGASPDHRSTGWQGVWTGSELFVIPRAVFVPSWVEPDAWLYDPATDRWRPAAISAAPPDNLPQVFSPRVVWTGSEVIILGYQNPFTEPSIAGAAYDPVSGTWRPLLPPGSVSFQGRDGASLVWTGTEAILWGGMDPIGGGFFKSGVAYDPATDSWRDLSRFADNVPSARADHTAVWDGSEMIVWGGWDGSTYLATGALYDPSSDTWTPMTTTGTPPGRRNHAAVWTGTRMMIWGGEGSDTTQPGWLYDPVQDQWAAMDTTGEPGNRTGMALLWAGDRAMVWGGTGSLMGRIFADGAAWSSGTGWTTIGSPAPQPYEHFFTSAWTGNEFLVWGGHMWLPFDWYGWRYEPGTGTWTPMSSDGQPAWRMGMPGVWTGRTFIVWGGREDGVETDTGGVYDPVSDGWRATNTSGAPSARSDHTAVWTGNRMVVWGGAYTAAPTTTYFGDGGAYDPDTDTWSSISDVLAPSARRFHTAVWDGSEMIVWGGEDENGPLGDGARYDPSADTWTALTPTGAPAARWGHTAVQVPNALSSVMALWGGTNGVTERDDGAIWTRGSWFENWTDILHDGTQPGPRSDHTAVLTGQEEMIVWGGHGGGSDLSSGGIYSPAGPSWRPTDQPTWLPATYGHAACWDDTEEEMLAWGGTSGHRELLLFHPTAVPRVVFTPDSAAVCPGDQVTVSTDPGGYDTYTWSPGGSTDPSVSFAAGTTVTYSVEVTAAGYGAAASATLWVPPEGDVNRDGLRSGGDPLFLTWTIFGLSAPTCADVDGDGLVNARDLATWIARDAEGWN